MNYRKAAIAGLGLAVLFGVYKLGQVSEQENKKPEVVYVGDAPYVKTDADGDGNRELMSSDGRFFRLRNGSLEKKYDMDNKVRFVQNEIVTAAMNNDYTRLGNLRQNYSQGYIDAALAGLASLDGFDEFRSRYSSDGVSINVNLDMKDVAFLELARLLRDRYSLVRRVEQERAEQERVQALRNEFQGYPADQLSPEQREYYRQFLNAVPEGQGEPQKGWQTVYDRNSRQTNIWATPEDAQAYMNEQKRQQLLQPLRSADSLLRRLIPPPRRPPQ